MGRGRGRGRGGRGGRGGKRPYDGDGGGGGDRAVRPRNDAWQPAIVSNGLFEEYYQGQDVCPPEEWDAFLAALKRPLPITFRINGQGAHADRLREKLAGEFLGQFTEGPVEIEGEPVEKPHPLAWYPGGLAWQMNFSRAQLRKLPVLGELHEFIKRENDTGAITRQEAVSMVPPLFMDVQPHHRVLDMCAAPGSKTFQLLEALHAGPTPATGLVVANDADVMRCSLLTHQTKRMCSPAILVTSHEAQAFPLLRDLDPASPDSHVLFDRILCDVPCSGDGTLRKAPDIWRKWNTGAGNGLHNIQLRIALRACELLRVGGRLVYSTCTFNPVEDEAVVAEVLRRTKGAFELVDVSDQLPGLQRLPGKQRWRVRDRDSWYDSWEQGKQGFKLDPTMFPDEASDALPLHLCMRFLPHHQDTGGFFVAVLRKVSELREPIAPVNLAHRGTKPPTDAKPAAAGAADAATGEQQQQQQEQQQEGQAVEAEAEAGGEAAAAKAEPMEAEQPAAAAEAPTAAEAEAEAKDEEGGAASEAAAGSGPAGEEGWEGKGFWKRKREANLPKELPEWGKARGGKGGGGGRHRGIDPIVPYTSADELAAMRSFYGLAPDCPVPGALVARSLEPRPKKLHFISEAVKFLLRTDVRESLKVVGAGVKVLERQDSKDGLVPTVYRFAQDGLPAILPHVTKQLFEPSIDEIMTLLDERFVGLPEGHKLHITKKPGQAAAAEAAEGKAEEGAGAEGAAAEPAAAAAEPAVGGEGGEGQPAAAAAAADPANKPAPVPRSYLSNPATLEQLTSVGMGCCVALMSEADAAALGFERNIAAIACWRGRANLNILVSKQEAAQLRERIADARAKLALRQAGAAPAAPAAEPAAA